MTKLFSYFKFEFYFMRRKIISWKI